MAVEGDIIVMDAGGDVTHALMGEMMLAQARGRGVAGFVLNGAIRDADAFLEMNVPTFAVGVTHRGPYKNGPGEINCPIAIGGMVVMPGDLVLGDADGVVAIPVEDVAEVYERTVAKHAAENKQMENILAGAHKPTWFNDALAKGGCELPPEE
jgi:regulator of RNase E activity RraA